MTDASGKYKGRTEGTIAKNTLDSPGVNR
jgi:hypothetical protein